jgi:hypothetical protein
MTIGIHDVLAVASLLLVPAVVAIEIPLLLYFSTPVPTKRATGYKVVV